MAGRWLRNEALPRGLRARLWRRGQSANRDVSISSSAHEAQLSKTQSVLMSLRDDSPRVLMAVKPDTDAPLPVVSRSALLGHARWRRGMAGRGGRAPDHPDALHRARRATLFGLPQLGIGDGRLPRALTGAKLAMVVWVRCTAPDPIVAGSVN